MAFVNVIVSKPDKFRDGVIVGAPDENYYTASIPSDWTAAGAPQFSIESGSRAVIILTDSEIEFVMVRTGSAATTEQATRISVPLNGVVGYLFYTEEYDNDFFVRVAP